MSIFISHSVKGEPEKEQLARQLYETLAARKLDPFLDLELLEVGDRWELKLSEAVRICDAAVVLLSRKAVDKSQYILKELAWITGASHARNIPILPVFLDDVSANDLRAPRLAPYSLDRLQAVTEKSPDWIDRVVDILARRTEQPLAEILTATVARAETLPYFAFSGESVPPLSRVYVPQRQSLYGAASAKVQAHADTGPSGGLAQQADKDVLESLSVHRNILLRGGPGQGKSTLLNWIALTLSRQWQTGAHRELLPVYVTAAGLARHATVFSKAIHLEAASTLSLTTLADDFFENAPTRSSHWLVLVDALDEIVDASARKGFVDKILQIASVAGSPYRFVVTSRPLDETARFQGDIFGQYDLLPFTTGAVEQFAFQWCSNRPNAEPDDAERFLTQIQTSRLADLAHVPLLLTMAAIVVERSPDRRLPLSRSGLYMRFIDALLNRPSAGAFREEFIAQWKRVGGSIAETAAEALLGHQLELLTHVASTLHSGATESIITIARSWFAGQSWAPHSEKDDWFFGKEEWLDRNLSQLLRQTGLVTISGGATDFLHSTFREFLAAWALHRHPGERHEEAWAAIERWQEPLNRELVLFFLGLHGDTQTDLRPLFRRLLSKIEEGATLAALAMAEGVPVPPEIDNAVVERLLREAGKFGIATVDRRPNVAQVLALLRDRPRVVQGLVDLTRNGKVFSFHRTWFVHALASHGAWSELSTIAVDHSLDLDVRIAAADLWGQRQTDPAGTVLRQIVQDRSADRYKRLDAINALGRIGLKGEAATYLVYEFRNSDSGYLQSRALIGLGTIGRTAEAMEGILSQLMDPLFQDDDLPARTFKPIFAALAAWGLVRELIPHLDEFGWKDVIVFKIAMWMVDQGQRDEGLALLWPPLSRGAFKRDYLGHAAAFYCAHVSNDELVAIPGNETLPLVFRYEAIIRLSAAGRRIDGLALSYDSGFVEYQREITRNRGTWEDAEFGLVRASRAPFYLEAWWRLQRVARFAGDLLRAAKTSIANRRNTRLYRLLTNVEDQNRWPAAEARRFVFHPDIDPGRRLDVALRMKDRGDQEVAIRAVLHLLSDLNGYQPERFKSWFERKYWLTHGAAALAILGRTSEVYQLLAAGTLRGKDFFSALSEMDAAVARRFCTAMADQPEPHPIEVPAATLGEALRALGHLTASTELVNLVLSDQCPQWVKVHAVRELGKIGATADLRMIVSRDTQEIWTRCEAVDGLAHLKSTDDLIGLCQDTGAPLAVRRHAIWAMGELSAEVGQSKLRALQEREQNAELQAAWKDAMIRASLGDNFFAPSN